jgi:hypothetical protein
MSDRQNRRPDDHLGDPTLPAQLVPLRAQHSFDQSCTITSTASSSSVGGSLRVAPRHHAHHDGLEQRVELASVAITPDLSELTRQPLAQGRGGGATACSRANTVSTRRWTPGRMELGLEELPDLLFDRSRTRTLFEEAADPRRQYSVRRP